MLPTCCITRPARFRSGPTELIRVRPSSSRHRSANIAGPTVIIGSSDLLRTSVVSSRKPDQSQSGGGRRCRGIYPSQGWDGSELSARVTPVCDGVLHNGCRWAGPLPSNCCGCSKFSRTVRRPWNPSHGVPQAQHRDKCRFMLSKIASRPAAYLSWPIAFFTRVTNSGEAPTILSMRAWVSAAER
jgi:hypothetical protein